jgi:bis(5'-nucleosyl)-tetraphosphatase (symmetrical)
VGSTLIIGDVHGCYQSLVCLLNSAGFDPKTDHAWLVGDAVNGGPASLEVLRWAVDMGDRARVVLGNHDLYLLARIFGVVERKNRDTLQDILDSSGLDGWTTWLLNQPFLINHPECLVVHAGLLPSWDLAKSGQLAHRAEEALRKRPKAFLSNFFGKPSGQDHDLEEEVQAAKVFTRIRTCEEDGVLCEFSGPPEQAPEGCRPWYSYRGEESSSFFFGHWSAHGFRQWDNYTCLDSGCVWGKSLTAVDLETGKVSQVPNQEFIT